MKTKFPIIISMALLLLASHTSCSDNRSSVVSASDELLYKQQFDSLRQLVYQGDNEAALQLASYYIEGKGVERSYIHASHIHSAYCDRTEMDWDSLLSSYPSDDPYIIWLDLNKDTVDLEQLAALKKVLPIEAEAAEAHARYINDRDTVRYLKTLEELDRKGCELSVEYQLLFYSYEGYEGIYPDDCIHLVMRYADKYPEYYKSVAYELYVNYYNFYDPIDLQLAIKIYSIAKSYGMLYCYEECALSYLLDKCRKSGLTPVYDEDYMPY